ncbi:MAG: AraC family transcriptional regulator [Cyanobacteria bacterium P01_H01_bin.105]
MPLDHARTVDQSEYDAIWDHAWEYQAIDWQQVDIEQRRAIPQQLGQGEERAIELQPGLEIFIETSFYWRSLYLDYLIDWDNKLLTSFYLAGSHRTFNPGIQLEADREETAGETCLCYLNDVRTIEYLPAEKPLKVVTIAIDLDRLKSFGFLDTSTFPLLQQLKQGKTLERFHQSLDNITPNVQSILRQVMDCPYYGATKRMYLESKALELLALQFHQLARSSSMAQQPSKLRSADMERLQLARDMLQQQFDQPPSLLELARQVGLNDYKLKQGFRQVFGTTVFGYVNTCRMEQAQQLLCDRELTIAIIAERVGYASPSRFSQAFKRQLGITPSQYRRQLKI